ncbi:YkgJ family cysteine cluster protein [Halosimplex sp. TS25]|uniref:YkgJ family cysteine cluster protein n=1 Tax=Halosimplex rarum TaxID=3396619 RepID=UPI0039EBE514
MESLEAERERAVALDVGELADAIEAIGFECTRCGACCKAVEGCESGTDESEGDGDDADGHDHTATVFPDEVRKLQETGDYDWRDVARPMPYGLVEGEDGPQGETFEWALQTDDCGDCRFYAEDEGTGACTVHEDRPMVCRTYPFSVALGGTSQPMGEAVDEEGMVRAHECEGLGRDISRAEAEELAEALKERAIRELDEAIAVRDGYKSVERGPGEVVVHDSEGAKRPDGTKIE